MSDTEIRMLRYTMEQLSAELQAIRQYVSDIEPKLERTRKALDVAKNAINSVVDHNIIDCVARGIDPRTDDTNVTLCNALEQITALEQKDK